MSNEAFQQPDRLSRLRAAVAEVRAIDAEVDDLDEQMKHLRARRARLVEEELPDLMDGVPGIDLGAGQAGERFDLSMVVPTELGDAALDAMMQVAAHFPAAAVSRVKLDIPAVHIEVGVAYHAAISSKWEADRRRAAFDWFDHHGHGGLIETVVTATFPREHRAGAIGLVALLSKLDMSASVSMDESIHWARLTSWLREAHQRGLELPLLETIGARVQRVATVKPIVEKKTGVRGSTKGAT